MEKGVGIMNFYIFLWAIGLEFWLVVYVEFCCWFIDGCYGENFNWVQYYFQYQVLIKFFLDNIQEVYFDFLWVLGIQFEDYDICFVEDNWEFLILGVWGVGWEVWFDGMEVI